MRDGRPFVALEISPLAERHHTGIANVTKQIAKQMLSDDRIEPSFFFNRSQIPLAILQRCLETDGAEILWWVASRVGAPLRFDPERSAIAIYPGHKWHRRLFPTEVQIVHDLTTLLSPQFHTQRSVEFWQSRQLGDLLTSDLIVTVSQSTLDDVRTYYPQAAAIPAVVAPLAPTVEQRDEDHGSAEPYVLVLGTLEPRKNTEVILQCLAREPDLLEAARFVFVGRAGWGADADELIERYGLSGAVRDGRIVLLGFVADAVRDELMRRARCMLYVSQYEGFGLPVLEALALGTPVITGYGSSLPEAGGAVAQYCDVDRPDSVASTLRAVLAGGGGRERRRAWAAQFSWNKTWRTIVDAAISITQV